jgi:hypothetical protein
MEEDAAALVSPNVASLASLTLSANKGLYAAGANTLATYDLSALGRTLGGIANAAAGRTALAAASSGANSDITSLTGLTTALSIAQGGTGNVTGLAAAATALAASRSISTTGDATWSVNFDGTANATAAITLAASGVGAGTYGSVTVNAKGLVTSASTITPVANGGTGLAAQTFTNLTLQNGWTIAGTRRAAVRLIMDNVQLELQITGGTATNGTVLATLPVGFRPSISMTIPVISGPNTALSTSVTPPYIAITPAGDISCNNCSSASGIFVVTLFSLL